MARDRDVESSEVRNMAAVFASAHAENGADHSNYASYSLSTKYCLLTSANVWDNNGVFACREAAKYPELWSRISDRESAPRPLLS